MADAATATPATSRMIVNRDGLRLHLADYPPARADAGALPAICLPGLTRNGTDFAVLAAALSAGERPRRVLALDSRGRGRSNADPDWQRYTVPTELGDLLEVLDGLGIGRAVMIGTSRGGLVTMALAAVRPALIAGAVLNDIGPVLEMEGLARIARHVGKGAPPASWDEAVAGVKRLFGAQFPRLTEAQWAAWARRSWREEAGKLVPTYDPALGNGFAVFDPKAPLPPAWPLFEALAATRTPLLVIRGGLSDLLSDATVDEMERRHPAMVRMTVADQGHAPLLDDDATIAAILALCRRADGG